MMSLDELIANLESLIGQMEYVKDGDFVFARHPNLFVDWLEDAITVCKELYERFKTKTGTTLPNVEEWLSMAERRHGFTRKVKFGDIVLTKDHNLIIDIMKPLELALREMEENL
ncbi:MAG: hypothetical protein DRP01_02225 [Archaeoglobales archaeon]|nr:MAG: hypothetical protein DRP01_02225 [Archaeoglobales archaeon]